MVSFFFDVARAITNLYYANALDISSRIYYAYSYYLDEDSKIFGALASETDDKGIITRYYYDSTDGKIKAEINQTHTTGVCYTYDVYGRLTGVMPAKYKATRTYTEIKDAENVSYTYDERNFLASITTESTTYTFTYDDFGNSSSVKVGDNTLATYEYNNRNGKLKKINYGNGFSVEYVYNDIELLSEVWYNYTDSTRTLAYEYEYTADGQVYKFVDNINEKTTIYRYNTNGRVIGFVEYEHGEEYNDYSSEVYYNDRNELQNTYFYINHLNGTAIDYARLWYSFTYETDGRLKSSTIRTSLTSGGESYTYDEYDRVTTKTNSLYLSSNSSTKFKNQIDYTYKTYSNRTSTWVETYKSTVNGTASVTYTYTYDQNGNITKIAYSTGKEIRYVYDDLSQLVREDNGVKNATYVYAYDKAGNITSITTYALTAASSTPSSPTSTKTYGYTSANGWGDQLTSFNGTTITYDSIGNPLSYYNGYTFSWDGKKLVGATKGTDYYTFSYNDEGIRVGKSIRGQEVKYYVNGSQIVGQESSGSIYLYLYDSEGFPLGMQYHGASYAEDVWDIYWFERNLQGDIVALYDETGTQVITYTYDAFGNCQEYYNFSNVGSSPASSNPFRYRGYFYDFNLGLYYLGSRYYDPNTGRFISADNESVIDSTPTALTDKNLYAYCDNNPVMRRDDGGYFWDTLFDVVSLIGSVVDVITNPTDPWAWAGLAGDVVDLIPFVSGVGEATDLVRVATKVDDVVDAVDNISDVRKASNTTLEAIRAASKKLNKGDNYVYIARDADGIIEYVGITNNFARREAEWASKGRKIEHYIKGLDRNSARIVEQTVIETFGMSKNGGRLANKINSIATKNPLYEAVKAFKKTIK